MNSEALDALRRRLADADRALLRALAARSRFPRHGPPARAPAPPPPLLDDLLAAVAPPGDAPDAPEALRAHQDLVDSLAARQRLAGPLADARFDLRRPDSAEALAAGDRDRMAVLLVDLADDLRQIESIRAAAAELAPGFPADLAPLLWREFLIPWTHQAQIAHLLDP